MIFKMHDAQRLEREAKDSKEELARAIKVVEAAKLYESDLSEDSLVDLREAVREWKAGR